VTRKNIKDNLGQYPVKLKRAANR